MNSRERVLAAFAHQEPDRVPVDLGATVVTGLTVGAYQRLSEHLGLDPLGLPLLSTMFQVIHPDERHAVHVIRQLPQGWDMSIYPPN